jgi:hypothetical protein
MAFQDIVGQISGLPPVMAILKNRFTIVAVIHHIMAHAKVLEA